MIFMPAIGMAALENRKRGDQQFAPPGVDAAAEY